MSATASTIEYELVEEEEMDEANSEVSYASPPQGDDSQPESSPPPKGVKVGEEDEGGGALPLIHLRGEEVMHVFVI